VLIQDGIRTEGERHALTERLAAMFAISPADFRLSALTVRAPQPWSERLSRLQSGLKETLKITRRLVDANARYFRDGARSAEGILAEVFGAAARSAEYDAEGQRSSHADRAPAVLNVAG
jgi:hypothetical protein